MTPDQWERIHRIAEDIGWEAACAKAFEFGNRDGTYETREAVGRFLRLTGPMSLIGAAVVIEQGLYE